MHCALLSFTSNRPVLPISFGYLIVGIRVVKCGSGKELLCPGKVQNSAQL